MYANFIPIRMASGFDVDAPMKRATLGWKILLQKRKETQIRRKNEEKLLIDKTHHSNNIPHNFNLSLKCFELSLGDSSISVWHLNSDLDRPTSSKPNRAKGA